MVTRPVIFVSAVSKELKSARRLVAHTLLFLGYDQIWEDIFWSDQGDLCEVLRKKIDGSQGVVHLVGQCYGAEPPVIDADFGRVSYTQFEALYARQQGRKVWVLLLDDSFAADPHEPESDELRARQATYRERIRVDRLLYHPIENSDALKATVLMLRDELGELRRKSRRWAALVIALLVLIAFATVPIQFGQRKGDEQFKGIAQQNAVLHSQSEKLLQAVRDLPQAFSQSASAGQREDEATRLDRAYATLEENLKIGKGTLEKELPLFAEQLLARADTGALDRASALFATRKFAEAEKAALQAKDKALAAAGQSIHDAVKALELAGQSAEARIQYSRAMDHYRAAAALTSEERDPVEWAGVQWNLASVLEKSGQYNDAEIIWRKVIAVYTRVFGPEHPDTLLSRMNLATALYFQGKYVDAEQDHREVLVIQQRVLGPEHPDTLSSRMNLATALYSQGKYAEAEREHREVLAFRERVFGSEDPNTLSSRMGVANTLYSRGKYIEAEREYRAVLAIRERVLGSEHPEALLSRMNLAEALESQGKHAEAEQEHRSVLAIRERILGPEHPDTLQSRMNLAVALYSQGKHAEAEQEHRAVLAIQNRVLGPEHPDTLMSENNLAWLLVERAEYREAEEEIKPAIEIMLRVLGPDSPLVGVCRDTLGEALRGRGKLKESEAEHRAALALRERLLGPEAPGVLNSCYHLALTLDAEKNYPEAL